MRKAAVSGHADAAPRGFAVIELNSDNCPGGICQIPTIVPGAFVRFPGVLACLPMP